ncbi:MAG: hypothetical protein ABI904_08120 [Chloroflexota bacterium]
MEKQDDLFDWKHLTLWRISSSANIFSLIVVAIYMLAAIGQGFQYNTFAQNQYQTNLMGLFSKAPFYIFDFPLQIAKTLMQGLIYYLVLKGVALGLKMIVETDINYREKKIEEGEE